MRILNKGNLVVCVFWKKNVFHYDACSHYMLRLHEGTNSNPLFWQKLFCPDDKSDAVSRVYKLYDSIVNRRNVYLGRCRWPMTLLFTDSDTMWDVCIDWDQEKTSHFTPWGSLCPGLGNCQITFSPIHFLQWTAPQFPLKQACLRNCTLYIPGAAIVHLLNGSHFYVREKTAGDTLFFLSMPISVPFCL